jgi:hypothetical protein
LSFVLARGRGTSVLGRGALTYSACTGGYTEMRNCGAGYSLAMRVHEMMWTNGRWSRREFRGGLGKRMGRELRGERGEWSVE